MPIPSGLESIAGAQELYDWFGYWPSFHDAEVRELRLSIGETSHLVFHTWQMTDKVDVKGFYETTKHIVVEFELKSISIINITSDPWDRSIFLSLSLEKTENGFQLSFDAAYGLSGSIEARGVSIRLTPGSSL
ncbi:MAG: Imm50 family immunity protein [Candidatus Sulfotelmatobacter sp.]